MSARTTPENRTFLSLALFLKGENDNVPPQGQGGRQSGGEPFLRLPPATAILGALIVGLYGALSLLANPALTVWIYYMFGFVPGAYTGAFPLGWNAFTAPFTYIFLHGSWLHVAMNVGMLLAFGAGMERWLGSLRMVLFFLICGALAAFVQLVFTPASTMPIIGASGALSGLFGGALVMMQRAGALGNGPKGLLPLAAVWIGLSVVFGLIGGPDGSLIAWPAHIGGFVGGLALVRYALSPRRAG